MDARFFFRRLRGSLWMVPLVALMVPCGVVIARPADAEGIRHVADRALACTVGIRCEPEYGGEAAGTGIVISPVGHVLTATSVVPPGARNIRVTFPGYVGRDAEVVAVDPSLAAVLLKVEATGLPCLPLSRDLPAVGTTAYTASDVENALLTNGRATFSRGLVSGLYDVPRHPEAAYAGMAIETTAAVNLCSDGGPLLDESGRVCGMITLCMLPLRWQGTAVPTKVLLERFAPFTSGKVPVVTDTTTAGRSDAAVKPLRAAATEIAEHLVGIEVKRKFGVEVLPQPSWDEFVAGVKDFGSLPKPKRLQALVDYLGVVRAFESNQILRRPPGPTTGLIVSADGFVLTSLFNVGNDVAFVRKSTGGIRAFDPHEPIPKLFADPEGGLEQRPNAIESITVVLRDGGRHEAKVVARHEPLGVALLKIDSHDLPWYDVGGNAISPQLGDTVALVGHLPGSPPSFTLNAGIVSAPSRNRGYQLQTDSMLNYGNSGGPLIDRNGNFIGLATAPIQPETLVGRLFSSEQMARWTMAPNSGVGMAARGDRIRDAIDQLKAGKSFDRLPGPVLGVQPDASKAFAADVVVGGVVSKSPAERAGLKRGDVLLEFDGVKLDSWNQLTDLVASARGGQVVEFTVQRRGAGPRLVIAGRDVETADDLARLKKSLRPGERFEGVLSTDETRTIQVTLGENK